MSLRLSVEQNVNICASFSVLDTFGELEYRRVSSIKNESRQAETLAGLVALRKALGDRTAGEIVRDGRGRPSFKDAGKIDFSISHSANLSVAAVLDSPSGRVGVDIERIDERKEDAHRRIAERYFSEEEKLAFAECPTPSCFFKLWTAKEAAAKRSGAGLAEIISRERLSGKNDEEYLISHFCVTHKNEKYILAVCTDRDEKIDFICGDGITVSAIDIGK